MIGVVVWSSETRHKAVIWCEDHGALAYLEGRQELRPETMVWPEAGDLLELDSEEIGDTRYARNVSIMNERRCPEIPSLLRNANGPDTHLRTVADQGARVTPLRRIGRTAPTTTLDLPKRAATAGC